VVVDVTRRGRWLAPAAAALLAAWVVAPAAVPVYDGISSPDEPYRYVQPPPDAKTTNKPTTASATVNVRNGVNGNQFANSAETGPQISVYVPTGSLKVPSGATSLTLTATPKAPTAPLPTDGTIVTNVYDVAVVAGGNPADVTGTGHQAPTIQMRAPSAKQPGPVFEHRTATGWEQARTVRVGNDIYQASAPEFGDWALVQLKKAPATNSGGGVNSGLLVAGIVVLVIAGVILVIRLSRRTSTEE
jgi:hypothetical protein